MKTFIRFFVFIVACSSFWSCNDFLEIGDYFDDELKLDTIFKDKRYIEAYMWGISRNFYDESKVFRSPYTPGPYATDEAFTQAGYGEYCGQAFVQGEVNASNLRTFDVWDRMYRVIRQCNILINRIDEAQNWTAIERFKVLCNTRFFRAYAYYHILMDYGPPILMGDAVLNNNESLAYYENQRCLYDEAVEYICSELEEAVKGMERKHSIIDFGRPTQGAAYGLIARLRLQHASPLYNGGDAARIYFSRWTRTSDKKHYVQQSYDEKRWALAAAACKRVMNMIGSDGLPMYQLYTVPKDSNTPTLPEGVEDPNYYDDYPNGAAGIDHFRSVSEHFTGEAVAAINPEYVWGRQASEVAEMTRRSFPISLSSWSENCITQKVIDNFRMVDGKNIDESSNKYPYSEKGFSTSDENFSGYTLKSGVFNMYINREMRFYADVGFSGRFWPMTSTSQDSKKNKIIEYYYDAADGKAAAHNGDIYTATGYVVTKHIHEIDAWDGDNARRMPKAWGIIRYAEILLSYAEALNNLQSTYTVTLDEVTYSLSRDTEEMRKAFNLVRYRAGLPGLTNSQLGDPKTMQSVIEQERMIEFLHENRRFYDVRRWGVYEDRDSEPITGMNVDAPKSNYYERVSVNSLRATNRIIDRKMVFVPIALDEVRSMKNFDQNPGWEY